MDPTHVQDRDMEADTEGDSLFGRDSARVEITHARASTRTCVLGLAVAAPCALLTYVLIRFHLVILIFAPFYLHLPITVPAVRDATEFAHAALAQGRPLVPLYVLSSSDARWAEFRAPSGVNTTRVQLSDESSDAYIAAYLDPEFGYLSQARSVLAAKRCTAGHLYIWEIVSRDARCAREHGGCLIMEDDVRVEGNLDPRPFIDSWKSLAPDYVSLFHDPWFPQSGHCMVRDALLRFMGWQEDVVYVRFGEGTQAYMLTSEGADTLLEPLRTAKHKMINPVDVYMFEPYTNRNYDHGLTKYVERRYPLIHNDHGHSLIR